MREKASWHQVPDEEATYWRVACCECGFVEVKASRRNVELCRAGHAKKHTDLATVRFEVTPLVRVPDKSTAFPVYAERAE